MGAILDGLMRPDKRLIPFLILVLAVGIGCTVGPDYERPAFEQEVPDAWKSAAAAEIAGPGLPLETWWATLNDAKLIDLIYEARESNLSVQAAAARVRESRARLGIATGRYYPDLRDCLLVAVTEKRTKQDIGMLAEALEGAL